MKKQVLFVIESLECAGSEKSLVSLLNLLDYSKYTVDLMLFAHGKELEKFVPKNVNILQPLKYTEFARLNVINCLSFAVSYNAYKMLTSRFKYTLALRFNNYNINQQAISFWQAVSSVIEENTKTYDIAISYAQGIPTFYVADKVKAKKKIAWVNMSLKLNQKEKDFQRRYYEKYNKIVAVSDSAKEVFLKTFPIYSKKTEVIYDINNPKYIIDMASKTDGYHNEFNGIKILTIGRLAEEKGYDLAIDACKRLKDAGVNFQWYVLGKGPLQSNLERLIKANGITNQFILLGVRENPYPIIKNTDIYVQASKSEGFGLAIAEARMLNIPVVTTRFDSVYNQMKHEKNGLVVDMNSEAVYEGILRMIEHPELRESIIEYLKTEKKGNVEEIDKVNLLIG
jgi:glycosyltransferase involved in cell wall biosynthesis